MSVCLGGAHNADGSRGRWTPRCGTDRGSASIITSLDSHYTELPRPSGLFFSLFLPPFLPLPFRLCARVSGMLSVTAFRTTVVSDSTPDRRPRSAWSYWYSLCRFRRFDSRLLEERPAIDVLACAAGKLAERPAHQAGGPAVTAPTATRAGACCSPQFLHAQIGWTAGRVLPVPPHPAAALGADVTHSRSGRCRKCGVATSKYQQRRMISRNDALEALHQQRSKRRGELHLWSSVPHVELHMAVLHGADAQRSQRYLCFRAQ